MYQGSLHLVGSASGEWGRLPLRITEYGQQAGGMHPTGMHSCYHQSSPYLVDYDSWTKE